jgi:hypothetical protein
MVALADRVNSVFTSIGPRSCVSFKLLFLIGKLYLLSSERL